MNIFKKKNKSKVPNYVSTTLSAETTTIGEDVNKISYKWKLIAQEIHDIVNKK